MAEVIAFQRIATAGASADDRRTCSVGRSFDGEVVIAFGGVPVDLMVLTSADAIRLALALIRFSDPED